MRSLRSLLPLLLLPFFATSSPLLYARVVSIQDAQALGADNDALPFILEADLPLSTMRKLLISNPLNGPSFDKQDIEDMNRFRIQSPETIAIFNDPATEWPARNFMCEIEDRRHPGELPIYRHVFGARKLCGNDTGKSLVQTSETGCSVKAIRGQAGFAVCGPVGAKFPCKDILSVIERHACQTDKKNYQVVYEIGSNATRVHFRTIHSMHLKDIVKKPALRARSPAGEEPSVAPVTESSRNIALVVPSSAEAPPGTATTPAPFPPPPPSIAPVNPVTESTRNVPIVIPSSLEAPTGTPPLPTLTPITESSRNPIIVIPSSPTAPTGTPPPPTSASPPPVPSVTPVTEPSKIPANPPPFSASETPWPLSTVSP